MSKETKVWSTSEWICLYVDDGTSKATISLSPDEAYALLQSLSATMGMNPDCADDLRQSAVMIRTWVPEVFPANERGQVPFARAIMESVADVIERTIARPTERQDHE